MSASTVAASVAEIAALVPEAPPGVGPSGEVIAAAVAAIAERFPPERITLFGSRAYGVPTAESDVDLLVVMETSLSLFEQAWQIRESLGAFADRRLHPTVRTPEQVRIGLTEGDFFYLDAVARAVALYEADWAGLGGAAVVEGVTGPKQATGALIAKAESDHRGATTLRQAPAPEFGLVCFLSPQCVEKYLKAVLLERGIRFSRTHEREPLAARAVSDVPALAEKRDDLVWLSAYAVDIRSTGADAGAKEADRALNLATEIRRPVRLALGADDAGGSGT